MKRTSLLLKNKIAIKYLIASILLFNCIGLIAQNSRDISNQTWKIWLDKKANWQNDSLFLPPIILANIPTNSPGCGWAHVYDQPAAVKTKLPATVEQYFWDANGNGFGVSGNYTGVSWFTTSIEIPAEWRSKNISLDFESARMRTEVYVNDQLAGYNLIDGIPFTVDITAFIKAGTKNKLAVRITDPNGNFAWQDYSSFKWGNYETLPSHGFGGITGKVLLNAKDQTSIDDVFIKNTAEKNVVDIEITLKNKLGKAEGNITFSLTEFGKKAEMFTKKNEIMAKGNETVLKQKIALPSAKLWSPESPNLYVLTTLWHGKDGSIDVQTKRFGFRWFEVKEIDGDKMFFLNDKRIVLRSAISWGHWPVNGIFPTDEMARKQIMAAKNLGLNMLNFHRAIGQTKILDLADELGLLYYEEPGGYRNAYNEDSYFIKKWKREKLLQMIKRDRSHPSLIIYNMINEAGRDPKANEITDIRDAHRVDDTRNITFSSNNVPDTSALYFKGTIRKMHMLPYDTALYQIGWWDNHNAPGPGVYKDIFYQSPEKYERLLHDPKEIIFYGEEGATGTLPRLQLIRDEILKTKNYGWDGQQMIDQYNAFDKFLAEKGFKKAFKNVDELCLSFGAVSYYLQGRMIENIRISNTIDGYVTNGWESTKLEDHSGIVDVYRNFKGDPAIIAHYQQPLYIAVKLKNKVVEKGDEIMADFFIVNEKDLQGNYQLEIVARNAKGNLITQGFDVRVKGGLVFGQFLKDNVSFKMDEKGYTDIHAYLKKDKKTIAEGTDRVFAVERSAVHANVHVLDSSGKIQQVLKEANIAFDEVKNEMPSNGVLLLGAQMQPIGKMSDRSKLETLVNWVTSGNTIIVLKNAAFWCEQFASREITEYTGSQNLGVNWMGGNFFVREHPLFNGLPVNTAFNWEYQCLAAYDKERSGLRLKGDSCVVGCYTDHKNEMYSALSIIPVGQGKMIFNTLDLSAAILSKQKPSVVAKKILDNMINYSIKGN